MLNEEKERGSKVPRRDGRNIKESLIKWFNDSRFISSLLTRYRGAQRLRFCEYCGVFRKNIHWAMKNTDVEQKKVYSHVWLCDACFYEPLFFLKKKSQLFFSPELTTESWLYPKSKNEKRK